MHREMMRAPHKICRLFASLSEMSEHLFVNSVLTLSMGSPITGSSRSVRMARTKDAGRCGCDGDAASVMPAYFISSCSICACGLAVALAGVRTDWLPPSTRNPAMALLASVAAIAAGVAVRIATNSWSCWFCMTRLISSTSILSLLVCWSEGSCISSLLFMRIVCLCRHRCVSGTHHN